MSACRARAGGIAAKAFTPEMGPIATGLGEIFMYTLEIEPGATRDDGTAWTAEDLRTLQDWVIPAAAPAHAGRGGGQHDRRLCAPSIT